MRIEITEYIAKLPLGFTDSFGSGRLRKIISDSTGAAETYLAHQLPDKYGSNRNADRLARSSYGI